MAPPPDHVAHLWNEVRVVRTARGPIEVAIAGSGPCVLVIHGTPGSWRQCFSLAEDFSDHYTVVAPSRPGYGTTPVATGRTYDQQADAYAALLDALGIDRVAIVGASGGAPSSIAFAERFPARTAALALICAMDPVMIPVPPAMRLLVAPRVIGDVLMPLNRAIARKRLKDPKAVARSLPKLFTPSELEWIAADPKVKDSLMTFAWTHQDAPAGLAGLRNDIAQVKAAKSAGHRALDVKAPTLVSHGEADVTCPIDEAVHHAERIAGAQLERYADAGHTFFLTKRADVTARLRAFIEAALPSGAN